MKTLKKVFLIITIAGALLAIGYMENQDLEYREQMINATPCIVSHQNAGMTCGQELK